MQSGSFLILLVKIREACQTFFWGDAGADADFGPPRGGEGEGGSGSGIKKPQAVSLRFQP